MSDLGDYIRHNETLQRLNAPKRARQAARVAALEAVAEAGKAVLYHDERGQGVGYAEAMDALKAALDALEATDAR